MQDYYQILGVSKDATIKEIKSQYRKLAKETHPDYHPNDPIKEQQFKDISIAYATLSNPQKRKEYDNTISFNHFSKSAAQNSSYSKTNFDFSSFFDFSFNNNKKEQTKREKINSQIVEIKKSIENLDQKINSQNQSIKYQVKKNYESALNLLKQQKDEEIQSITSQKINEQNKKRVIVRFLPNIEQKIIEKYEPLFQNIENKYNQKMQILQEEWQTDLDEENAYNKVIYEEIIKLETEKKELHKKLKKLYDLLYLNNENTANYSYKSVKK